jgi:ABC-type phosphate/phosphonate transport system substrate-binding protein
MVSLAAPLKYGVSPWTSGQLLHAWTQPLIKHLEARTGNDYLLASGENLHDYLLKAAKGEFDVIMIPMHMGLFLVDKLKFKPLAIVEAQVAIHLVVNNDSNIFSVWDLNGTTLSTSDPIAISGMMTHRFLQEQNIQITWEFLGNQWRIIDALLKGEASAGPIVGRMDTLTESKLKAALRLLHTFPVKLDGLMIVGPDVSDGEVRKLSDALVSFKSLDTNIIKGIGPFTDADFKKWNDIVSPYFPIMQERLKKLRPTEIEELGW